MTRQHLERKEQDKGNREGTRPNNNGDKISTPTYGSSHDYIRSLEGSTRPGMTPGQEAIANIDWRTPSPQLTQSPEGTQIPVQEYRKEKNVPDHNSHTRTSSQKGMQKTKNKKFISLEKWNKEQEQQKYSLEDKAKIKNETEFHLNNMKNELKLKLRAFESTKSQTLHLENEKNLYNVRLRSLKDHLATEQENLTFNQSLLDQAVNDEKSFKERFSTAIDHLRELNTNINDLKKEEKTATNAYQDITRKIDFYSKEIEQYSQKISQYWETSKNGNTTLTDKENLKQLEQKYAQEKKDLNIQLRKAESEIQHLEQKYTKTDTNIHLIEESIKNSKQLIENLKLPFNHPLSTDYDLLEKELSTSKESQKRDPSESV
jgi:hypothetical protein